VTTGITLPIATPPEIVNAKIFAFCFSTLAILHPVRTFPALCLDYVRIVSPVLPIFEIDEEIIVAGKLKGRLSLGAFLCRDNPDLLVGVVAATWETLDAGNEALVVVKRDNECPSPVLHDLLHLTSFG
jgi:hypothetical protein